MYHKILLCLAAIGYTSAATLYPSSLTTQSGTVSSTSLSVLKNKDQSGNEDGWGKYVEFYGSRNAYAGVFTFDVSDLACSDISAYTLNVNYKGPNTNQVWNFEYFDASSNEWVPAGDSTDAPLWTWTQMSFCGQTPFASLVDNGKLKLRLSSATSGDDCDIDYLAIETVEGETTTPVTSAPATSAPTEKATQKPTEKATSAPTEKATQRPTQSATQRPTPTEKATQKPTERATQKPTERATPRPTERATQKPTEKATQKPTERATPRPTERATQRPTERATQKPTEKATSAPTQKATSAPTQKATAAPTQKATNPPSTGGRVCPAGQVWQPAPGTTWQWQLTGTIDQSWDVQMYDIDLFDTSANVISQLHSKGRVVICYFSTQYEDWRPDASSFSSDILGANLDDWPGERYVDIRSSKLRSIMTARLDLAVSKGCDGVEPDNVDGYTNSNGLGLTAANQIEYNKFLAAEAHKRGLSIGLKNDLDQVNSLVSSFDWALNEQCNQYGECSMLNPFVNAGKAVFGVDYSGSASSICPKMETAKMSWLMKSLSLGASGTKCCTYGSANCAPASYKCVSYSNKRSDVEDNETIVIEEEEEEENNLIQEENTLVANEMNAADNQQELEFDSAASSPSTMISSAFAVFSLAVAVASLVL